MTTTDTTTTDTPPVDKPFQFAVVSETHDPITGDDMLIRRMLAYTLRGVVTMRSDIDPSDWSVDTIVARVAAPEISFVVVVADIGNGPDEARMLGPKCFTAVLTAQAHDKAYQVMMPYCRYQHLVGDVIDVINSLDDAKDQKRIADSVTVRFVCGDEALRVPLRSLTCSFDGICQAVAAKMFPRDAV